MALTSSNRDWDGEYNVSLNKEMRQKYLLENNKFSLTEYIQIFGKKAIDSEGADATHLGILIFIGDNYIDSKPVATFNVDIDTTEGDKLQFRKWNGKEVFRVRLLYPTGEDVIENYESDDMFGTVANNLGISCKTDYKETAGYLYYDKECTKEVKRGTRLTSDISLYEKVACFAYNGKIVEASLESGSTEYVSSTGVIFKLELETYNLKDIKFTHVVSSKNWTISENGKKAYHYLYGTKEDEEYYGAYMEIVENGNNLMITYNFDEDGDFTQARYVIAEFTGTYVDEDGKTGQISTGCVFSGVGESKKLP